MPLSLKIGVRLKGLQPQMVLAAFVVHTYFADRGSVCTITSANDSAHRVGSLHYGGYALDFRTKNFTGDKLALVEDLREALGAEFDVILESLGKANEHLHVEYDPT